MDEVELLLGMVSIYSPTGMTGPMRDFLVDRALAMGLRPTVDAAGNVIMAAGEGPTTVMLLCHMDTVPGRLPVRLEGGALHGRGAVDAKGCLAMAMAVASARSASRAGRLVVVAVPDEEGPSDGVREVVRRDRPDYVVVGEPSGWEGITIGYKGAMRLRASCVTAKRHSGAGEPNSAEMAVGLWNALEAFCGSESAGEPEGRLFGRLTPTLVSFNTADDGVSLTTEMAIDVRVPWGYDTARLDAFIEQNRGTSTVVASGREPPVLAPKNNALVRAVVAAIRAQGGEPVFKRKTGTSDMARAAEAWGGVPILAYGPGDSRLDHTPEERLDIGEYRRAIGTLGDAVGRLLGPG